MFLSFSREPFSLHYYWKYISVTSNLSAGASLIPLHRDNSGGGDGGMLMFTQPRPISLWLNNHWDMFGSSRDTERLDSILHT